MGKIVLFYKYINISNPVEIQKIQRELCQKLELRGRVIIAHEGINATLGGSSESVDTYCQVMSEHPLFTDIDFKIDSGGAEYFPKLKILIKKEIVRLGIDPESIKTLDAGKYLTPEEFHKFIEQKQKNSKNLVLLDTRNSYESEVGTFKDAIIPNTENFRDFPEYINNNLELFKDKEVLMFCTGGVRCERGSAYLKSKNIAKEVYHLQGGIFRYIEKYPNGYFDGRNYVFDGRVTVKVNDSVIASCRFCKIKYDECSNCINAICNARIVSCPECAVKYNNTCSQQCQDLVKTGNAITRSVPAKTPVNKRVP